MARDVVANEAGTSSVGTVNVLHHFYLSSSAFLFYGRSRLCPRMVHVMPVDCATGHLHCFD